jgi:hypothetical protein
MRRTLLGILASTFLGAAAGATVPIPSSAATGAEGGKLVWIQAAYEGDFKGYRFPMKLSAAFFASLITNLHADPQFKKGADGYGAQPVVRMDYEHASAMPPTEGSIPASGVPAPGWVCDLEVRPAQDGGPLELWALCSLGDQLREQIAKGEYRFTSIDAALKAKDNVTGEDIGPKLRALAVTNDPFLRDLEPMRIAASANVYISGPAESPEELLIGLRQLLQLPDEAVAADIATAVQSLGAAFEAGQRGPGYPDGYGRVLDGVRQLLGLPILATADQIVAAAGQALGALSASTSSQPATPTEGNQMASTALSAKLSLLFNCADDEHAILAAATKASGSIAALDAMMATYGAKDPADLATKAAAARDAAGKAAEFATKLSEALAALDGKAQEEQAQETEAIAASLGFKKDDPRGTSGRSIIMSEGLAARRAAMGVEVAEDGKTLRLCAKDDSRFKAYRASYPLLTGEQQKAALLTTPITAGAGGVQLGGAHTALTQPLTPHGGAVPEHIAVLSAYAGANDVERAIAYLSDKQAGFGKLDWHRKNFLADQYLRTGKAA